jgi:hypothetical protein
LWQDSPLQNSGPNRRILKENFFVGNGISQFVDPESPLSIGLQTAPWPPKFKPVSLPKYNGFRNSRKFLMRYESSMNSAGGDDVALAKSFIIPCEGLVLNWYSLLQPHSVCSWVDLKTKFMQAFQMFHDTTTESLDLYNYKQKDREPLRNFMRRFMQQRSQILEADDKTTIKALIKGLTPGPIASHFTQKKPKKIDELFHELEEYILYDDDHRRRVAERNEARQGNREMTWRPQSQNLRNINNVENPQPNQNNRPSTREGFSPRGRGRGRGPPRLTNHDPRDPHFYCQYHGRGHSTEGCPETKNNIAKYCLLNDESITPELLATTVHEFPTKSSHNTTISATTTIMATFSAVLPSVAGNSRNRLDPTVARFLEDVCPLRRSEGDVFYRSSKVFMEMDVGVNPLPRGASVGELGKTLSVIWTSLGPLPRWVPGPTTRWAPGTTRLALHGT